MGLDMYLSKKTYVKNQLYMGKDEKTYVTISGENPNKIKGDRVEFIEESIMYWRKANHIHKWFVDYVQSGDDDCGEYEVSISELRKLRDLCKLIMDDNERAEELLPCTKGFFFGTDQYDEYYFHSIYETYKNIKELVEDMEGVPKGKLTSLINYRASW
tara:strand:- start:1079 stop:1552 length:474 start_codon:yes stop_codon:yes gene_type:complete